AVFVLAIATGRAAAQCAPCSEWAEGLFPGDGIAGVDGTVDALLAFDDGTGPALYVGGGFMVARLSTARGVARWDGRVWSGVGGGLGDDASTSVAHALAVFDDGTGRALYAGGSFGAQGSAARWNGRRWTPLAGAPFTSIQALAVFDDGGGRGLCAAGDFA